MRPDRDNIAAPDLPQKIAWIGEVPESMPVLTAGGPGLVHFFDFAQLNSVRAPPWRRRQFREGRPKNYYSSRPISCKSLLR